jgi:hypothetical protein
MSRCRTPATVYRCGRRAAAGVPISDVLNVTGWKFQAWGTPSREFLTNSSDKINCQCELEVLAAVTVQWPFITNEIRYSEAAPTEIAPQRRLPTSEAHNSGLYSIGKIDCRDLRSLQLYHRAGSCRYINNLTTSPARNRW